VIALHQTSVEKYGFFINNKKNQWLESVVGFVLPANRIDPTVLFYKTCRRFATPAKTVAFGSSAERRVGCVLHAKQMPSASGFATHWDNRRHSLLAIFLPEYLHDHRPQQAA
jgi:hypothetical protein